MNQTSSNQKITAAPRPLKVLTLLAVLGLGGGVGCDGKWSVNRSSVTRVGNGTYNVAVKVDKHPEIKRSYAFPVEVKTDKASENGVERAQVTITRKEGGEVVERLRL